MGLGALAVGSSPRGVNGGQWAWGGDSWLPPAGVSSWPLGERTMVTQRWRGEGDAETERRYSKE